jgi:hypothetical protein
LRRFRRAYVEIAKGNGKSPLAAGIGHYMLVGMRQAARGNLFRRDRQGPGGDPVSRRRRDVGALAGAAHGLMPKGVNPVWELCQWPAALDGAFFKPISSDKRASPAFARIAR